MEKFLEIVKVFLEKHFLPALASIVLTGITFFFTSENFPVLEKLGKLFYLLVIFALYMFLIEMFIRLVKHIKERSERIRERKEYQAEIAEDNEKFLLDVADSLSPEDRKKLDYFMENSNASLVTVARLRENSFLEQFCNMTEFEIEETTKVRNPFTLKKDVELKKGCRATKYKLKNEVYIGFKHIKEKTGKISRFD